MRSWFILAFSLLLTANATNGTKSTDGKTFVCNQYNGQNSETNQAIEKIDEKLDKIIEMLQPCPYTAQGLDPLTTKSISVQKNELVTEKHFPTILNYGATKSTDCSNCDSRIGFGTGGYHDDSNTCGNEGP
ncbi:unnamed protein product [Porites evermanni]|uniref:Uncharacterized protein n=1 Tax=Porites evermanni TaxID=104178 RepID=A0ABN8QJT0_9CNID|nr:unnamed protein product [Porites evermanni]